MLSANFAAAFRSKQALKNCFLFFAVPGFEICVYKTPRTRGHDCRKIKVLHEITDFHFAKYRFSFRKVQISFRKVQIFISQSTDFISFRFAKYNKPFMRPQEFFLRLIAGRLSLSPGNRENFFEAA